MKKDVKEVSTKTEKELRESLASKRSELYGLVMDNKLNKLKNTRSIYTSRKEIARIMTLIREKELAALEMPTDLKGESK